MSDFGRYSPLREAHRRGHQAQLQKEERSAAKEVTERRLKLPDQEKAPPQRAEQPERKRDAAASPMQPDRPIEAKPHTLVPNGPVPGETEGHFAWRRLTTQRIERDNARDEAREADTIPRILRTEKNPISRSTELKSALDRLEAEAARRSATPSAEKEVLPKKGIEVEP